MLRKFQSFVKEKALMQQGDVVLLAVSGGLDSVVMADLFFKSGIAFAIAHCNFKLRGDTSDGDEQFVKELAKNYAVDFFAESFNTSGFASEKGISIQMAARDLRYAFFEKIRNENGFHSIATAHHTDDFVETVLINLTRGSGTAAFHGIKIKSGNVIRPMLFASRNDIEMYAGATRLNWREDASNAGDDYMRNKIRHHVIPVLKELNPSLIDTFLRSAKHGEEVEKITDAWIDLQKNKIVSERDGKIKIDQQALLNCVAPLTVLYEIIRHFGFSSAVCEDILKSLEHTEARRFYAENFVLTKDRNFLIVEKLSLSAEKVYSIHSVGDFRFGTFDIKITELSNNPEIMRELQNQACDVAFVDAGSLTFPLTIRQWKQGDCFSPLGMKGRKLISDFFTDEKYTVQQKMDQLFLVNENGIVWIIGKRLSEKNKVTETSEKVYRIQYKKW